MQIGDMAGFHRTAQPVDIGSKLHTVLLHYVARATDRGRPIVPMFHDVISGTGYDKAGSRADIERILSVASRPHNIDRLKLRQIYRDAHFEQCLPKPRQFLYGDITHQVYRYQAGNL